MSKLKVLTDQGLDLLRTEIPSHLKHYKRANPWLAQQLKRVRPFETTGQIEFAKPLVLVPSEGKKHFDIENSIRMHQALPSLSRLDARNPRLWAHVCHSVLWSYMRTRWPVEKEWADKAKAQRYVLTHYFVPNSSSRHLLRNGAARLWWYAHLTHDPSRKKDPYVLTRTLLSRLDITQQILERAMGRCDLIRHRFLDFINSNQDICLHQGNRSRDLVRHLARSLNFHGGVCLLDSMTRRDLDQFFKSGATSFEESA